MTGLEHARGDLVFLLDVDLEEQPEWLAEFHRVMQQTGADAVYGVQARRKGGPFERLSGAIFYKGFNALLDHPIPANAVTARLMTRRYVNSLILHRDREMTMAPLWAMTGYTQIPVVVEKKSRRETSYSVSRRVAALVDNITSFSNRPLVYIFYLGSFIMFVSAVAAVVLIWKTEHGEVGVPGWPTLIVSIWFLGGIMIFCLGVIGVYLSKDLLRNQEPPLHHRARRLRSSGSRGARVTRRRSIGWLATTSRSWRRHGRRPPASTGARAVTRSCGSSSSRARRRP